MGSAIFHKEIPVDREVQNRKQCDYILEAHPPRDGYEFTKVMARRGTISDGKEAFASNKGDDLLRMLQAPPLEKCLWADKFQPAFEEFAPNACISYRADWSLGKGGKPVPGKYYTSLTYKEVHECIIKTGSLLNEMDNAMGLVNQLGDKNIAIWGKNCPEYYMTILACWRQNCAFVPLYDTLGIPAFKHILGNCGCKALFCQKSMVPNLIGILENRKSDTSDDLILEAVVIYDELKGMGNSWDNVQQKDIDALNAVGVKHVYAYWDYVYNKAAHVPAADAKPTDTAIIMHTSGTTGLPKGVVQMRRCVTNLSDTMKMQGMEPGCTEAQQFNPGMVHFSYLPLGHIFEVCIASACLSNGLEVCVSSGDIKRLAEELALVRPHTWVCVPRVLQKFYDKIQLAMNEKPVLGKIINWQVENVKNGTRNTALDFVLKKVLAKLGLERVAVIGTGSAPLPDFLHLFWRAMIPNVSLGQGYGMTETTINGTLTRLNDPYPGSCGPPMAGAMIMLRSDDQILDMGYSVNHTPPTGEVLIGGQIGVEYYRQPEKTADTYIDLHGVKWVASGDIGRINPEGTLSIIDRKKNLFKLAQGEYVSPEKVENKYLEGPAVNQCWIFGHSEMTQLVGVIVPAIDWVWTQDWFTNSADAAYKTHSTDKGVNPTTGSIFFMEWVKQGNNMETLRNAMWAEVKLSGKWEKGLKGFEKLKKPEGMHLECTLDELATGFNPGNGLTTPSMKTQRPKLKKKYLAEGILQKMYNDLGEATPTNW